MNIKTGLLHLLWFFSFSGVYAQDGLLVYGYKKSIQSSVLAEDRKYFIALPDGYEEAKQESYPVIYLLDAEINFQLLTGINSFFARGRVPSLPKTIVVGILNTDRTRDLTPSRAADTGTPDQKGGSYKNSGGADRFLSFIQTELKPEIEKHYRSNGHTIFAGHSFGGLTVVHTYLNHPDYFDAFLAMDPSLWWDNAKMLKKLPKTILIPSSKPLFYMSYTTQNRTQQQLSDQFKSNYLLEKKVKFEQFEDESHGTIALRSLYNGLKFFNNKTIR